MFTEERHNRIIDIINKKNSITVIELAKIFNISEVTIRRDLKFLELNNLLSRTHGGAIKNIKSTFEPFFEETLALHREVKQKIAKFAVSLLEDNESIILGSSSTNIYFSQYIPEKMNLKVFTNDPTIVSNLRKTGSGIIVHSSGGKLKKEANIYIGSRVQKFFNNIITDKAFIPVSALNKEKFMTMASSEEAEYTSSMIDSGRMVIALSDSSKFNSSLLFKVGHVKLVDVLVTDNKIDSALLKELKTLGIIVHTV